MIRSHAAVLVMWVIFYRGRLVPRPLAAFGILGAAISTSAVALAVTGVRFSMSAVQPLGVATLLLTLWLLWKGFPEVSASGAPAPSA